MGKSICCVESTVPMSRTLTMGCGSKTTTRVCSEGSHGCAGEGCSRPPLCWDPGDGVTLCVPGHCFWQRAGRRWGLWLGEHCGEQGRGTGHLADESEVCGGLSKPVRSPCCGQGRSAVGSSPASPATAGERKVIHGTGQCHMKYFHHRESPAPKVALNIWKFC